MFSVADLLSRGLAWTIASVFVAGVATSLTPCVYPMIPITVSLFGARQAKNRRRAFLLASCYVAGIAITYAGLGLTVALGGWAIGGILASRWFVVPLALLFVAMAASMFGLWKLTLPSALASRLALVGGQGAFGAFAMGIVGGIIIAPCTGPILAGLLAYVAMRRDVLLGGALLLAYALGIGVLFWVIATFSLRLPRPGRWMEAVQSSFGVVMLVAALYYLQHVLPPLARYESASSAFLALNLLLVIVGVLSGGLHLSFDGVSGARAARKALGVVVLTVGLWGLINYTTAPPAELRWVRNEMAALTQARTAKRPLLIDFWARWCVPCKQLEAQVLSEPSVQRELSRFVLFKADVSEDGQRDRLLRQKYRADELPLLILVDSMGRETARLGHVDAPTLLQALRATD